MTHEDLQVVKRGDQYYVVDVANGHTSKPIGAKILAEMHLDCCLKGTRSLI